jgi:hypothetical protein
MPNHVTNILTFVGDEDEIAAMHEAVKNKKYGLGTIDFNKIIPMPRNIYRGNLGVKERRKFGKNNWYDWSVDNWGTKWNAYGYDGTEYGSYTPGTISFLTAWAAPHPVIRKLSALYHELEITHEWANEDYGSDCGRIVYRGGEQYEEYYPEYAEDILDFVSNIFGIEKEELRNGQ